MSARNFAPLRSLDREKIVITGRFVGNNVSNPAAANNVGMGWTVARTGVGVFRVTLTEKYAKLVKVTGSIRSSGGAAARFVSGGAIVEGLAATNTADLGVFTSSTGAAYEPQSTDVVSFEIEALNSAQVPLHS